MVTTKEGILTTQGVGSGSTQATRVLVDYKDALQDYRVTALPVVEMFAENFTTETGGDIDITFAKQSMNMEQIEEGTTPKFQSTDLRNERVSVKEWGIAVGVTRRMMEDSRFSEGTSEVAKIMSKSEAYSIIGGGETITSFANINLMDSVDYASTAGGAFLEYIENDSLPCIDKIINKNKG